MVSPKLSMKLRLHGYPSDDHLSFFTSLNFIGLPMDCVKLCVKDKLRMAKYFSGCVCGVAFDTCAATFDVFFGGKIECVSE